MTLRETRVKTLDGKDVFVPNGMILKMPLYNHTIDNHLRGEFLIGLDYDEDIAAAIKLIEETVNNFTRVGDIPPAQVLISDFSASTVNLKVHFWFETRNVKAPGIQLKSDLMLRVLQVLTKAGYKMPAKIVELKMHENTKGISSSASS